MQKQFSVTEAKRRLPSVIHDAEQGEHVSLTRRGRPVAVLLSVHEYERLAMKKHGFWNALTAFRQAAEKEGIEISDSDFEGLRDLSEGRQEVEW